MLLTFGDNFLVVKKIKCFFIFINTLILYAGADLITHYDVWVYSDDSECGEGDMDSYHYREVLGSTAIFMLAASNGSNFLKFGCTYTYTVSWNLSFMPSTRLLTLYAVSMGKKSSCHLFLCVYTDSSISTSSKY